MAYGEVAQLPSIMTRRPLINGCGLAVFALMGLRLPQCRVSKLLYILLQITLQLVTASWGGLRFIGPWFMVLVIRNCQFLERRHHLAVTLIDFGVFFALQVQRRRALNGSPLLPILRSIPIKVGYLLLCWVLAYSLFLIFLQLLIDSLLSESRSRQRLGEANAQIRQYAAQVEELATVQERNRIARDIHDALGHSLTALNVHLEAVTKLWSVDAVEARFLLSEAQQLAQTALTDVRQSVSSLRSDPLAEVDLKDAIASLLTDFKRTHPIQIVTDLTMKRPIPTELKIAVYRVIQEALTNIVKHAEATIVTLTVQAQEDLLVTLQDNGIGFDLSQNTTGFGLQSMCERTYAQAGEFDMVTAPGKGCQITLSFPLAPRE